MSGIVVSSTSKTRFGIVESSQNIQQVYLGFSCQPANQTVDVFSQANADTSPNGDF